MRHGDERIEAYLSSLLDPPDPVQAEMESLGAEKNFPIVGPLVGQLLKQVALSVKARDIFEMGSGFGYSTLFFAQAVGDGGRVVHTDTSASLSRRARIFLRRSGLISRVAFEVGNGLDIITRFPGTFDIVFIDVEKRDYPAAFDLARVRVRTGGYIITDNVLWQGRVLGDPADFDESTAAIHRYNQTACAAPDFITTILPLRDGVALHYKIEDTPRRVRSAKATVPRVPSETGE